MFSLSAELIRSTYTYMQWCRYFVSMQFEDRNMHGEKCTAVVFTIMTRIYILNRIVNFELTKSAVEFIKRTFCHCN